MNQTIFKNKMVLPVGMILIILAAAILLSAMPKDSVSAQITTLPVLQQQNNAQQTEQSTDTGTVTTSQDNANAAGQETVLASNIGWLPITGNPKDIELTGYGSIVRVYVYANGKIDAKLMDENLKAQQKAVGVRILFKDENNKNFETGQVILGRNYMSSFIDDWGIVTGIKNPAKLQWQPQFTIVNLKSSSEAPVDKIAT